MPEKPFKKRILFAVPSLSVGGAQRVVITLLKLLPKGALDIHLALVSSDGPFLKCVPKDITIHNLKANRVIWGIIGLLKLIKRIKPAVVMSTLWHLNIPLLFLRGFFPRHTKLMVRETTIPSLALRRSRYPAISLFLMKKYYVKADLIICASKYMQYDLIKWFDVPIGKTKVIHNPVDVEDLQNLANRDPSPFDHAFINILASGRLTFEKGFDLLILGFKQLVGNDCPCKLTIIGEGSERQNLEKLIAHLDLLEYVNLPGLVDNPYPYYKNSDLFVICSRYEGLPNALIEAAILGQICVAVDNPGGIREVAERFENIYLYNNIGEIFKDLKNLLNKKAINPGRWSYDLNSFKKYYNLFSQ